MFRLAHDPCCFFVISSYLRFINFIFRLLSQFNENFNLDFEIFGLDPRAKKSL